MPLPLPVSGAGPGVGIRTADLPWALWVVRDDSQRGSDWYRLMKKKAHWLGSEDTAPGRTFPL